MFEYDHGNLPICFNTLFNKTSSIHSYGTSNAIAGKLSENASVNTTTHGITMFKFKGPKVFNNIKDFDFYAESKCVQSFRKKYKSYFNLTYAISIILIISSQYV